MRRRLAVVVSVMSLLLGMATHALWARGYWMEHAFVFCVLERDVLGVAVVRFVVSLLLGMATSALWARGYWMEHAFVFCGLERDVLAVVVGAAESCWPATRPTAWRGVAF